MNKYTNDAELAYGEKQKVTVRDAAILLIQEMLVVAVRNGL